MVATVTAITTPSFSDSPRSTEYFTVTFDGAGTGTVTATYIKNIEYVEMIPIDSTAGTTNTWYVSAGFGTNALSLAGGANGADYRCVIKGIVA
jgi:hypothetical protein